jgi:hypothetical protein
MMRTGRIQLVGTMATTLSLVAAICAAAWMLPGDETPRSSDGAEHVDPTRNASDPRKASKSVLDVGPFMRTRWAPPSSDKATAQLMDRRESPSTHSPLVLLAITTDARGSMRAVLLDERDGLLHRLGVGEVIGEWVVRATRVHSVELRGEGRTLRLALDGSVTDVTGGDL